ncbi:MAG: M3 family metallopeptidase [Bryobacterales bacterium]|nr:M3 family metallopeptidase [Bryobacterales bacterium]
MRESSLPFQYIPWDKIRDEHFLPALEQGMAEERKEVEAIATNPQEPTFENTIVALQRGGRTLGRARRAFLTITGAHTNPTLQKAERELAPKLAAHNDAINLNEALFARVRALHQKKDSLRLDPESKYLLERVYTDFTRAGAQLGPTEKERLKAINGELAALGTRFAQNVLKDQNASAVLVAERAELAGMPEAEVKAAADAATREGKPGQYLIRLRNTTVQPQLSYLENRDLRRRLMEASLARNSHGGEYDNRDIVVRTARLRAERSALLGYPHHAAYQIAEQTAGTVDAVNKMLLGIAPRAVRNAEQERAELQAVVDKEKGGFQVEAWDWPYYAEKLRKQRYAFDEGQLRPYLELDRVLKDGVFFAAGKEFGITFKERHDLPVYHPTVRVFDVFDEGGKPLAIFIADFYARPSKRGGAWNAAHVRQSKLLDTRPVIANHLNIQPPPEGQPTLLTWDEVNTMFHEFGHALHGMFSNVTYPREVPRDFVEFPSQVNQMWSDWPSVLKNYARHYQTGKPMPAALLNKVLAASKFNQGYATTEYLAASLLDQAWHQVKAAEIPDDAVAFEAAALRRAEISLPFVPSRYRSFYFTHIFSGGYAAGYYSYIWSEVLDADTVQWFKRNGGLTRKNGDRFRSTLLSRGGSEDAMSLYRKFTGRNPDVQPLLERRGLTAPGGKTSR